MTLRAWIVTVLLSATAGNAAAQGMAEAAAREKERREKAAAKAGQEAVAEKPLIDFARERLDFRRSVTALFSDGTADALEEQARDLRVRRPRFSSGTPVLFDFYEAFNPDSAHIPTAAEAGYADRVLVWAESRPDSLVATMAAIKVLKYRAWKARGKGFAHTVTDQGWETFHRLELQAWSLAETAERRGQVDAALYYEMLELITGLGKPRSELDETLRRLLALDPAFDQAFVAVANHLLPRWQGSQREVHEFALEATERTRSVMGSTAYARVAIVVALVEREKIATEYPFEYRRLKQAFEELDARYPNSGRTINFYAWFALTYGDLPTAHPLLDRISRNWTRDADEVWGSRTRFDQARAAVSDKTAR
jgi:hypothetical protein